MIPWNGDGSFPLRRTVMHARRFAASLLFALAACQTRIPLPVPPEASDLRDDVAHLTTDLLEGRALGTAGRDSAAVFIALRFHRLGLRPAFPESCTPPGACGAVFFQRFRAEPAVEFGHFFPPNNIGVNVAAVLPGSNPELRREYVVIGAHYDHIGKNAAYARDGPYPGLRPGADDNASGTAALLELARTLSRDPPPRSILFVAFDAEELGLFGSAFFVDHPPVPLASMVAMLNLDMVGRLRGGRLWVLGVETAPEFRSILERANERLALELRTAPVNLRPASYTGSSDQYSFYEKGIPVLHFFTGLHSQYHSRFDRVDLINFAGMLKVIALVEGVVREIANTGLTPRAAGR